MSQPLRNVLGFTDLVNADEFSRTFENNKDATVKILVYTDHAMKLLETVGTGIMISENRLLTCHHVIPSVSVASVTMAEFFYRHDGQSNHRRRAVRLLPHVFYCTHSYFDYAIIAVDTSTLSQPIAHIQPQCPPHRTINEVDRAIYSLSHPSGRPLQYGPSGNRIAGCPEYLRKMWFTCEAHGGSSGGGIYDARSGILIGLISAEGVGDGHNYNEAINIKNIWLDFSLQLRANDPMKPIVEGVVSDCQILWKSYLTDYSNEITGLGDSSSTTIGIIARLFGWEVSRAQPAETIFQLTY